MPSIPSGSLTLFHNSNAPVGWTKITSYHDYAMRITSGTPGTGGTRNFSSVFSPVPGTVSVSISSFTAGGTAAPSYQHQHPGLPSWTGINAQINSTSNVMKLASTSAITNTAGSGQPHTHSVPVPVTLSAPGITSPTTLNFDVKYIDVILAQRN